MRIVKKKIVNNSRVREGLPTRSSNNNNNIESTHYSNSTVNNNSNIKNEASIVDIENEKKLLEFVNSKGFKIIDMNGDGNCMFRAIAYQLYGDQEMHSQIRNLIMNYMETERDHYSPYVSCDYDSYITRKRENGCFGNSLELLAASEMFNRPIEVYSNGNDPLNIFNSESSNEVPIRVSYHNKNHYNAVEDPNNPTFGIGLGLPNLQSGNIDKNQMKEVMQKSENEIIDKIKETTELELIENEIVQSISKDTSDPHIEHQIEQQILEESRQEYWKQILQNCTDNKN